MFVFSLLLLFALCLVVRLVLSSLAPFAFVRTFGSTFTHTHTQPHSPTDTVIRTPLALQWGNTSFISSDFFLSFFFGYLTRCVHRYDLSISEKNSWHDKLTLHSHKFLTQLAHTKLGDDYDAEPVGTGSPLLFAGSPGAHRV